jgi:Protein of unknown function (DUF2997)
MKLREYDITISATGEVEIHVEGFRGKGCLEALKQFEALIGETREVRPTSGYYEPEEDVHLRGEQHH